MQKVSTRNKLDLLRYISYGHNDVRGRMHPGVYFFLCGCISVFFFYLTADLLELAYYLPLLVCAINVIYARC